MTTATGPWGVRSCARSSAHPPSWLPARRLAAPLRPGHASGLPPRPAARPARPGGLRWAAKRRSAPPNAVPQEFASLRGVSTCPGYGKRAVRSPPSSAPRAPWHRLFAGGLQKNVTSVEFCTRTLCQDTVLRLNMKTLLHYTAPGHCNQTPRQGIMPRQVHHGTAPRHSAKKLRRTSELRQDAAPDIAPGRCAKTKLCAKELRHDARRTSDDRALHQSTRALRHNSMPRWRARKLRPDVMASHRGRCTMTLSATERPSHVWEPLRKLDVGIEDT